MSERLTDGKLHISDADFASLVEQVLISGRKIVDQRGLKVAIRLNELQAYVKTFNLLAALTSEAGGGQAHYDLVVGGIDD